MCFPSCTNTTCCVYSNPAKPRPSSSLGGHARARRRAGSGSRARRLDAFAPSVLGVEPGVGGVDQALEQAMPQQRGDLLPCGSRRRHRRHRGGDDVVVRRRPGIDELGGADGVDALPLLLRQRIAGRGCGCVVVRRQHWHRLPASGEVLEPEDVTGATGGTRRGGRPASRSATRAMLKVRRDRRAHVPMITERVRCDGARRQPRASTGAPQPVNRGAAVSGSAAPAGVRPSAGVPGVPPGPESAGPGVEVVADDHGAGEGSAAGLVERAWRPEARAATAPAGAAAAALVGAAAATAEPATAATAGPGIRAGDAVTTLPRGTDVADEVAEAGGAAAASCPAATASVAVAVATRGSDRAAAGTAASPEPESGVLSPPAPPPPPPATTRRSEPRSTSEAPPRRLRRPRRRTHRRHRR